MLGFRVQGVRFWGIRVCRFQGSGIRVEGLGGHRKPWHALTVRSLFRYTVPLK